jgi:hypothetical protein
VKLFGSSLLFNDRPVFFHFLRGRYELRHIGGIECPGFAILRLWVRIVRLIDHRPHNMQRAYVFTDDGLVRIIEVKRVSNEIFVDTP